MEESKREPKIKEQNTKYLLDNGILIPLDEQGNSLPPTLSLGAQKENASVPHITTDHPSPGEIGTNVTSGAGESDEDTSSTLEKTGEEHPTMATGAREGVEGVGEDIGDTGKVAENPEGKREGESHRANDPAASSPRELTTSYIRNHIPRLIEKVEFLALRRLERMIDDASTTTDASKLVEIVMKLADLKLTRDWTDKLEEAILKNTSLLAPGKNTPHLQALQGHVNRLRRAQAGDQRESGNKLKKASGQNPFPLPQD